MGASLCYKKNVKEKFIEEYYDNNSCSENKINLSESVIKLSNVEFGTITCSKSNNKKILKEFEILKKIGLGSFGVVYLAIDSYTYKKYAVKCVNKQKVLNGARNSKEHFNSEIKIMQKINSKNILKLHKLYQDQTNYYLVVDYCNKGDFVNFLKNRKLKCLEEKEAIFFLNQIKNAFIELRKNNVLHRDIKLENLFIDDKILKIGDFGFSKITENLTDSKLGSKYTMAPEIILNLNNKTQYDYKCDLWSIGCVFYEMLFGKRFLFDKISSSRKKILNMNLIIDELKNYHGFFEFPRKVSVHTQDLLKKLLVKDNTKRMTFLEFISHPIFMENYENINFNTMKKFSLKNIQPICSRKKYISYRKI